MIAPPESREPDLKALPTRIDLELRSGLPVEEVETRIARAHRCGDMGARAMAFYLLDLSRRGAHQQLGFRSVIQYAELRHRLRPATTREYLAVGRALDDLPQIDEAWCNGRLYWSQARLLVKIAVPETESAWLRWAENRTVREIAAQIRGREKGQLPTEPARRRIHSTRFRIRGTVDAVGMETWNTAKAKLQAKAGRLVSDAEMMIRAARAWLDDPMDDDGDAAPLNPSHYTVVVMQLGDDGTTLVQTDDGPVALDPDSARAVLLEAGREDLAAKVPDAGDLVVDEHENTGPTVPPEDRDRPTPPKMRRRVLARDGYRCRCCGNRKNPSGHHRIWACHGGPTEEANLNTLCEDCHSLTHDRLLKVGATTGGALRFTDAGGRPLSDPAEAVGETLTAACAAVDSLVSFTDVPARADAEWWARHAHLFSWKERQGSLEFTPGAPAEPTPTGRTAARAAPDAGGPALADVVGQRRVVEKLDAAVRAAKGRGDPVPHTLLYGPPGLGKTTLAHAVASEAGVGFLRVSGPVLTELRPLVRLLTSLQDGDVLFVDEIHRLPPRVAETLYQAMEEGSLSLPVHCGRVQKTLHVQLSPFTLIAATTEEDLLPRPLLARFKIRQELEFYSCVELEQLAARAASSLGISLQTDAARYLARLSRETPRETLTLVDAVRDEMTLLGRSTADLDVAMQAAARLGIDKDGLLPLERRYLEALADGPLGLATLAAKLGVSKRTLRKTHEPYLIRRGLVSLTRHGRMLTHSPANAPS